MTMAERLFFATLALLLEPVWWEACGADEDGGENWRGEKRRRHRRASRRRSWLKNIKPVVLFMR